MALDPLGNLAPDEEKTILRNGASLGMANSGDLIMLLNNEGQEVDRIEYSSTSDGVEIINE